MSATSANIDNANLSNRQRVFAILRASSGNLLEWSGFYFFSYCMIYFAPAFFPHENPTTQLLQATAVFAVGFLARPIGGWFYGRLADRQGRRKALVHSGIVMLIGSFLLAASPTYATIGYAAPALLVCARLLQGLSVGGDYGTSATYMSEVAIKNQRGFLASFQYTTLIGGQVIAILTMLALEQLLTKSQLLAWGWRIPFILGTLGALLSIWLRLSLQESATQERRGKQAGSLKELLQYKRELLTVFVTTAAGSTCFYTFTTYMQKYLVNSLGLPSKTANLMLASALAICMCLQPLLGALSDRIGRLTPMLLFSGLMTVSVVPIIYTLTQTTESYIAFALILSALTILSFYTSIGGVIKAELFPSKVRALGVSFSYAIANAVFGGSTEYIALWTKSINMEFIFYGYITLLCFLSLIVCAWCLPTSLKMDYLGKNNS
jgi:MHS family alpha-ketoglutarate permease-like MFS transporter